MLVHRIVVIEIAYEHHALMLHVPASVVPQRSQKRSSKCPTHINNDSCAKTSIHVIGILSIPPFSEGSVRVWVPMWRKTSAKPRTQGADVATLSKLSKFTLNAVIQHPTPTTSAVH